MKTNWKSILTSVITTIFLSSNLLAQPSCSPSSTNPNCAGAVPLTVGGACVTGTTCDGGAQSASSCLYSGSECSWYSFTATAADMFVNVDVTATGGCHISSNVYEATGGGGCIGSEVSCQSGTPLDDMHSLTGLTIGDTYYVQVCYSPGGPCGNSGSADYCINVGVPDPPCDVCATPCGTATGYPTNPTVQNVVDDCITTPFVPELQASSAHTFCYNFTATATSVNFNVIITSNCGGGNVTGFSWDLYNNPACGAAIQSGTLASLTFTGLTINNSYVFCYTFTVPATCTHSQHCPFFVGATVPLPINLIDFSANEKEDGTVSLFWTTASELNNDFFTIERTLDGVSFESIGTVEGAGTSDESIRYTLEDKQPNKGVSYYRLKQTDFSGEFIYSGLISVGRMKPFNDISIVPNPISESGKLIFNSTLEGDAQIDVRDIFGRTVISQTYSINRGVNTIPLSSELLNDGMYILSLGVNEYKQSVKFIKE